VKEGLDAVRAGLHVGEALRRVAEDARVEDRLFARSPAVHVDAEDLLALRDTRVAHLEARLGRRIGREQQQHAAVEGPLLERSGKAHDETEPCGLPGPGGRRGGRHQQEQRGQEASA
jgi:hypothetical protein